MIRMKTTSVDVRDESYFGPASKDSNQIWGEMEKHPVSRVWFLDFRQDPSMHYFKL